MKRMILLAIMFASAAAIIAQEEKVAVTGAGYANDAYYSLENGTILTIDRINWDIAFTSDNFSVAMLANNGAGVEVFTYTKGDTSDWATLDTTGMTWTPMYNSLESMEDGAFNRNSLDFPDYGWGIYDMNTHEISGDSLFIVKTVAGDTLKLQVVLRAAAAGTWEFKFARLDGTGETTTEIINTADSKPRRFVHYSLDNKAVLEREPDLADWDLLFTKYFDYNIPYNVTGVLSNEDHIEVLEVKEPELDQATFVDYDEASFTSQIGIIGSDWKSFNGGTFTYDVATDVVFFIKKYTNGDVQDSAYYKLYFTGFTGSTEGIYTFQQEKLISVSAGIPGTIQMLEAYPNPAAELIHIVFDYKGLTEIDLYDISGRAVQSDRESATGLTSLTMNISNLNTGLYFVRVKTGQDTRVLRFIKE